jgi:hypothetical protein
MMPARAIPLSTQPQPGRTTLGACEFSTRRTKHLGEAEGCLREPRVPWSHCQFPSAPLSRCRAGSRTHAPR